MREVELKRQEELNKKAASLEKEHAKALMEQLASKERALQQMKEHYEQMAEERVQKYCLECEGQHQSKRDELMKWELELTAKQERLSVLESECQRVGGELREERGRVERLQELLHDTTSKQVALQQQKDVLQQRLAQVGRWMYGLGEWNEASKLRDNIVFHVEPTWLFCRLIPGPPP